MLDLLIRTQLARYFDGAITLDDFEEWFVSSTWNVELAGQPANVLEIAEEVSDALFDLSTGDSTAADFKRRVRPLAAHAREIRLVHSRLLTESLSAWSTVEVVPTRMPIPG